MIDRRWTRLAVAIAAVSSWSCSDGGVTAPPAANPVPAVFAATPPAIVIGGAPPLVTIFGEDFVPGSRARLNGTDRPTTVVNDTLLRMQLLAADVDTAALHQVTVVNPTPGGGTSGIVSIRVAFPTPTITSVSPDSLAAGSPATTIVVRGRGFRPRTTLFVDGIASTQATIVDSTEARVTIPATALGTARLIELRVANPGAFSLTPARVAVLNPAPTITSVTPDSALRGTAAPTITLRGAGFRPNAGATVNGESRVATVIDSTTLRVTLLPADVATLRTLTVRATNEAPAFASTAQTSVRVVPGAPALLGFTPASANAGAGNLDLRITGTDFTTGSIVELDGVDRPTTIVSETEVRITVPASALAAAGTRRLRVRVPARGLASGAVGFPVLPPQPTVGTPIVVDLPNAHVVADPVREVLYATVPVGAARLAQHLVRLNPTTGAIIDSLFLGSAPTRMAIADDGSWLYVALDGAPRVVRVRLSDFTTQGDLVLPGDSFLGAARAEDVEVVPGNSTLVAVSLRNTCCSPRHSGVALFSGVTRLPVQTQGHTGSNRIAIASPTELWGYNNETTEFGFRRISISEDGLREVQSQSLFQGFGVDIEGSGARVVSTTGVVIVPATMSVVGTLSGGSMVVRPDAATGRVHTLVGTLLTTYNLASLATIGVADLPDAGGLNTLVRWGTNGLAVGGGARIVFVRGSLIGP